MLNAVGIRSWGVVKPCENVEIRKECNDVSVMSKIKKGTIRSFGCVEYLNDERSLGRIYEVKCEWWKMSGAPEEEDISRVENYVYEFECE